MAVRRLKFLLHLSFTVPLPSDMDSQITSPAAPDPLAAMLHNAPIDQAGRNEFSNTARETVLNFHQNSHSAVPTGAGQAECVSLEKISDPSNALEESSHALQGTRTPALQAPLTQPDDDYTPIPAAISLTLPRELVEHILLLLDTRSILKCKLVNREFNAIIQSSTLVQYYLACKAAGVIDNPQSPLSYGERLEALKRREDAWKKLKPVFETTIKVIEYESSTFYDLSAGNYFILDKSWKDLYYCLLPSSPQDNPQWLRIPGHGPGKRWSGFILEIGMAVYEHDLVVNVISSEIRNQAGIQRHSVDLVLLKFSTGEYHPLARRQLLHVRRSTLAKPYTSIKIVGDSLALVIHDHDGSKLFIFDWKTGHRRLRHKATEDAYHYSDLVFVSPELLLVPNSILSHLEVWHLPSHPNTNLPLQILSLQIPAVSDNYFITTFDCHGEPSPFLHSMPYFPPRPFFPSSENSIIIVNLKLYYLHSPQGVQSAYKLIMHRYALRDMIQKWVSPSLLEQQGGLPTWLTNEVTVHKVADPDDGSVRLTAESESVSTMPHPGFSPRTRDSPTLAPTYPTLKISTDSSSSFITSESASSTSRYNIFQVQWADWGPPISRWFQVNGTYPLWLRQSTGQRYVFLDRHPHDERKCTIAVADFNLHNVRRNAKMMAQPRGGEGEENGGNSSNGVGKKKENEEELEILEHQGEFSEEVYMGLKCVVYQAPGEYDFDAVLMDEERLLGLKVSIRK
ncbi:hypothetical protein M378DRAFT_805228 [Amanita muscaria Koide BX008]|uniref:F-box domain-containing protein n=1 Tax=Amanita muscaria (strain Koide BX008) TaxID=946122 RepID=A0A0C2X099_AMAMK|nr:hypothetical protein M378DRAFT_805228 [Amanita muscaria Koide BX008]